MKEFNDVAVIENDTEARLYFTEEELAAVPNYPTYVIFNHTSGWWELASYDTALNHLREQRNTATKYHQEFLELGGR